MCPVKPSQTIQKGTETLPTLWHQFDRLTLTWAVGLLAQQEGESPDFILAPGCGQHSSECCVVGAGRQLNGLPLELHQRLVTSPWKRNNPRPHSLSRLQPPCLFLKRCNDIGLSALQLYGGGCDWAIFVIIMHSSSRLKVVERGVNP